MKKVDQGFVDYLIDEASSADVAAEIEELAQQYSENVVCGFCNSSEVDITIYTKVFLRCRVCRKYSEINIDSIPESGYSDVILLKEGKIKNILKALEEKWAS